MAVIFLINGIDRSLDVTRGTPEIDWTINQRTHLRLTVDDPSTSLYRPAIGQSVLVYDGLSILFSGTIISTQTTVLMGVQGAHTEIEAVDTGATPSAVGITFSTVAGETLKTALTRLVADHLAANGITLMGSQPDGPTMIDQTWTAQPASAVLDAIANRIGYVWGLSAFNDLLMVPSTYAPAGDPPAAAPTGLGYTIIGTPGAYTVRYAVSAFNEFGMGPKCADLVINNAPWDYNVYTETRRDTDYVQLHWDPVTADGTIHYVIWGRSTTNDWLEYNSPGVQPNNSPDQTHFNDNDNDRQHGAPFPLPATEPSYGSSPWTITDANAPDNLITIVKRDYDPSLDLTTSNLTGATPTHSVTLSTRRGGLRPGQLLDITLTNPPINAAYLLTSVRAKADLDNVFRYIAEGDEGTTYQGSDTDIWTQYGGGTGYGPPQPLPCAVAITPVFSEDFELGAPLRPGDFETVWEYYTDAASQYDKLIMCDRVDVGANGNPGSGFYSPTTSTGSWRSALMALSGTAAARALVPDLANAGLIGIEFDFRLSDLAQASGGVGVLLYGDVTEGSYDLNIDLTYRLPPSGLVTFGIEYRVPVGGFAVDYAYTPTFTFTADTNWHHVKVLVRAGTINAWVNGATLDVASDGSIRVCIDGAPQQFVENIPLVLNYDGQGPNETSPGSWTPAETGVRDYVNRISCADWRINTGSQPSIGILDNLVIGYWTP